MHTHSLDFGGLAHETYTGDQYGLGRMGCAEAGHFQGVGDTAAGFFGQGLDHRIAVEVGNQHRVLSLELGGDGGTQACLFLGAEGLGLLGVEVGLNQ